MGELFGGVSCQDPITDDCLSRHKAHLALSHAEFLTESIVEDLNIVLMHRQRLEYLQRPRFVTRCRRSRALERGPSQTVSTLLPDLHRSCIPGV